MQGRRQAEREWTAQYARNTGKRLGSSVACKLFFAASVSASGPGDAFAKPAPIRSPAFVHSISASDSPSPVPASVSDAMQAKRPGSPARPCHCFGLKVDLAFDEELMVIGETFGGRRQAGLGGKVYRRAGHTDLSTTLHAQSQTRTTHEPFACAAEACLGILATSLFLPSSSILLHLPSSTFLSTSVTVTTTSAHRQYHHLHHPCDPFLHTAPPCRDLFSPWHLTLLLT